MLDCGWDIHFDTALLEPLRSIVKRVDLVLISHPDLEHLGVRCRKYVLDDIAGCTR